MNEGAVISLYLKYQSNETSRQCPEVPISDGKEFRSNREAVSEAGMRDSETATVTTMSNKYFTTEIQSNKLYTG